MNGVVHLLARRTIDFLLKPKIRYKYLPRVDEVISFNRKERMLWTCFEYAAMTGVEGDYFEFGVWKGGSLIAAYHISRQFEGLSQMRFYGFDSFEGIPVLSRNKSEAEVFPPGMFQSGGVEQVRRNLNEAKVDLTRIDLIEGWYADTLNCKTREKLPIRYAAVVNIDCDVYESTIPVLDFIEPHLIDGSIVIFDDWYCFGNRSEQGQQKALREWLERNRGIRVTPYKEFGWDGKAFIINRSSSPHRPKADFSSSDGAGEGPAGAGLNLSHV